MRKLSIDDSEPPAHPEFEERLILGMPEEVYTVLVLSFFAGMAYWQLSPFYPAFLNRKGLDKMYVGIMLSTYALSFLFSAYITGSFLLKRMTRLTACFLGGAMIVSDSPPC